VKSDIEGHRLAILRTLAAQKKPRWETHRGEPLLKAWPLCKGGGDLRPVSGQRPLP